MKVTPDWPLPPPWAFEVTSSRPTISNSRSDTRGPFRRYPRRRPPPPDVLNLSADAADLRFN